MRNYYLFLVLVFSFLGNNSCAQNDVYFNQYASIRYLNNPAELTFNRKNGLYYFRRDQWLNSPLKSANNSILTGQLNISRTVDLGLSMSQYNSGNAYSNSAYQLHLAWKGRVNDESNTYFSFGTNLKFGSLRTDFSNVLLFDPNDPQIPLTITSQNYWDVGTGFNFKADWFNIGLALNSLRGYSNINSNNFLFARTVTYNLGFNLMDADGGDWDTHISRPNIYLRVRSINNAVWQGEGFVDFNIHMGNEDQRNYTIVGVGVRRDFSTTYYNSILAHINLSFGGRAKLLLGVGPEFSTAPLGNVSSGNMEYIVGIEKGTKTDRFYQSLYEGDARLRQNKYLEAGESYKNAKDIFPNSDLVERREKKTYAISQAWNEFNQFKDFAEQSFVSGNYILAYDQIQSAEKSLNNYKYELKKLTSRTNVNAEESYVKSKKGQYEKAKIADHTYLEGVKLFEEKKYSYALSEFEKAKRGFEAADVSISGDLINKMEVCKSIIKRQEEEEKIKKIQNLIVTAKEKFKNEDYAGSLYDLNQILNGLDPNNIDAKNLKKEAEAKYQEQELKRRKKECDEHYDLALKLMEDGDLAEALIHIDSALDALESCERCVALKSKIEKEIENKKTLEFDKLVTEGDRLRDNGNFAEALLLYRRAKELIDNERIRAKIEDSERKYSQSITNSIGVAEIRGIVENSVFEVIVTHTFKNYPSQGGQGSGFFISTDGVALTNSHVTVPDFSGIAVELTKSFVERKMLNPSEQELLGYYEFYLNEIKKEYLYSSIEVIIHSGANKGKYKGRVLKENVFYMDTENDWSFIKVDGSGRKFGKLEIANSTPNIDEKVFAIGFPLNEEVSQMLEANNLTCTITEGKINNTVQPTKIPMSCNIDHGNSGGPLVNSRGKVIGINTWGLRDNSSGFLNYAINIKSLPYSQYIH